MKKKALLFSAILLLIALPVSAAVLRASEEYSLSEGEVIEGDLYAVGGNITISGDVEGDLVAVGGSILINGSIGEDINVGGGAVDILATVGDDIRVVAGQVVIGEDVAGDIIAVGGVVHILSSVTASGDVVISAGKVIIDGEVVGNVRVYGGEVTINGKVGGSVEVFVSDKFSLGERASIMGNLTYQAPDELELADSAIVSGEVIFKESKLSKRNAKSFLGAFLGVFFITKILMLITAGLLAVTFFRKFSQDLVERAVNNFTVELLRGFIVLIVVPVAVFLLIISVLGFFVGITSIIGYIFLIALSKIYAGIVLGSLLSKWIVKKVLANWQWAIVGITLLQLIGLIPVFGWIVTFVLFLIALGSVSKITYERMWRSR